MRLLKHALLRLSRGMINTALWLLLWVGALGLLLALVFALRDADWIRAMRGWHHALAEIGLRLLILLPLALWTALLLHPLRTRRWMLTLAVRGGQQLLRTSAQCWARLRRRAPADRPATAEACADPAALRWLNGVQRPLTRRRLLLESAVVGGGLGYAMFVEPRLLQVREVALRIPQLPPAFEGYRIAQISDLHINAYTTGADLALAVERINQLRPDLVVITGDFVDWNAAYADEATRPFARITAPDGIVSILGNHDYYTGEIAQVRAAIQRHDLGLLVNQHTLLRRGGATLALVGLDDPRHDRGYSYASIDPARAMRGLSAARPRLLLVHNPVLAPWLARSFALDAIICGHTHGGQFRVPILTDALVSAREYFVAGLYDLGRTQVYVNRGFGFTGPPLRFATPPEITLHTLHGV